MMICVTLFGAQATGASAEAATAIAPPPTAIEPVAEDAPRFYAEEVVQALPESKPADTASLAALVQTMPADAPLSRDLQCLAQAIYFEARGEPLTGQLAVGAQTGSGRQAAEWNDPELPKAAAFPGLRRGTRRLEQFSLCLGRDAPGLLPRPL